MIKLVVVAPGNFAPSGGPEALHQLVNMANIIEPGSSAILYEPSEVIEALIQPYSKYNCPTVKKEDVPSNALIVLPEIWPELSNNFTNKCALWWLSVDFFGTQGHSKINGIDYHLAQSHYAYQHIRSNLEKEALMLSDWIDLYVHESGDFNNIICVNPAKGADLIDLFESNNPDLSLVRLRSMSKNEVINSLISSKIYIDFGHHPGKDRIPREASLCGCVVLVKKAGAANYYEDVSIDDYYKFDDLDELKLKVKDILSNFSYHQDRQSYYRDKIKKEKDIFKMEVSKLLQLAGSL